MLAVLIAYSYNTMINLQVLPPRYNDTEIKMWPIFLNKLISESVVCVPEYVCGVSG